MSQPTSCPVTLTPLSGDRPSPEKAIVYRSRGAVLVVGEEQETLSFARRLAEPLRVVAVAPRMEAIGDPPAKGSDHLRVVRGRVNAVTGWLGAFRADIAADIPDADTLCPNEDGLYDLVIDLSAEPLIRQSVPPPGYLRARSPAEVAAAAAAVPGLVGDLAKPRFFHYEQKLCAHHAFGTTGCTRCIEACAAGAITSGGSRIVVEAHLCQGCAACTLACPTGALTYRPTDRDSLMARLDMLLAAAAEPRPLLVVYEPDDDGPPALPLGAVGMEVPALASFGEELWLAALARGARGVALVLPPRLAPETRRLLDRRLADFRAIGEALWRDPGRIAVVNAPGAIHLADEDPPEPPAADTAAQGRETKRPLLSHLLAALEPPEGFEPVALAHGAPLGTIVVDEATCTLCSTCARVCPTGAIRFADAGAVRLDLLEAACVQCGICGSVCPEGAIRLVPRLAPASQRQRWQPLNEDVLAACTACGRPFVPAKLQASIIRKATTDQGMTDRALEQLRRCPDCRHLRGA